MLAKREAEHSVTLLAVEIHATVAYIYIYIYIYILYIGSKSYIYIYIYIYIHIYIYTYIYICSQTFVFEAVSLLVHLFGYSLYGIPLFDINFNISPLNFYSLTFPLKGDNKH